VTANLISFRFDQGHFFLSSQFVGEEQPPALAIDDARIQEPALAAMFDGLPKFHRDRASGQRRRGPDDDWSNKQAAQGAPGALSSEQDETGA